MSIQRPSCLFNLCSSCSSRSNKRRRDACSLLPAVDCVAAQVSSPHRTPIDGLAIPLLTHACCYSLATVDEPVNPRIVVLPSAWETTAESPCLRVVPFLGLAVVHRPGALSAALLTWSTTDMHLKWTLRGEADSWVHGRTQGNASLLRAK